MFLILRILGWSVAAVIYAFTGLVMLCLGLLMLTPVGWLLSPGVFIVATRTRSQIRRRRGFTLLDHVRRGIDLNLPLPRLLLASSHSEGGVLGERLLSFEDRIGRGASIGDALEAIPELSPRTRSLLRAAESIGRLPQTLGRLVEQQRTDFARESTDVSFSWTYPAAVASMTGLVVMLMCVLIMPRLTKIFEDFGVPLPETTLWLMGFGKWVGGRLPGQMIPGMVWLIMVILTLALIPLYRRTPIGRTVIEWALWHLPVSHGLERDRGMGDVCHLLEEATRAAVPIEAALVEAGELQINVCLHRRVREWAAFVSSGATLERGARAANMPSMFVGMLAIGHDSTSLPQALGFLGRYYDNRCSRAAAILQGAAVPIIVLVLAAMVAWIVVSMFLPLVVLIRSLAPTGILP